MRLVARPWCRQRYEHAWEALAKLGHGIGCDRGIPKMTEVIPSFDQNNCSAVPKRPMNRLPNGNDSHALQTTLMHHGSPRNEAIVPASQSLVAIQREEMRCTTRLRKLCP